MNYSLLEKLVNDSKVSKKQISEITGLSRTTIDNTLNGADAKISTIEAIAKAIGVKTSVFFEEKETSSSTASVYGDGIAAAGVNGNLTVKGLSKDYKHLEDKIKLLEELLAEKERLISVLMEGRK